MKSVLAFAFVGLLAASAPAFAQDNAGQPGATGTGGSLTGSDTGGPMKPVHSHRHMMRRHRHHRMMHHHAAPKSANGQ